MENVCWVVDDNYSFLKHLDLGERGSSAWVKVMVPSGPAALESVSRGRVLGTVTSEDFLVVGVDEVPEPTLVLTTSVATPELLGSLPAKAPVFNGSATANHILSSYQFRKSLGAQGLNLLLSTSEEAILFASSGDSSRLKFGDDQISVLDLIQMQDEFPVGPRSLPVALSNYSTPVLHFYESLSPIKTRVSFWGKGKSCGSLEFVSYSVDRNGNSFCKLDDGKAETSLPEKGRSILSSLAFSGALLEYSIDSNLIDFEVLSSRAAWLSLGYNFDLAKTAFSCCKGCDFMVDSLGEKAYWDNRLGEACINMTLSQRLRLCV